MKELRTILRNRTSARNAGTTDSHFKSEIMELVDKASSGDFEAFGKIYSMYLDPIYRYVFYQVKDKMAAEDITEEVFVKAWKAISTCRGKGRTFSAWLYRIAHNQVINVFRSRRKEWLSLETAVLSVNCVAESRVEAGLEWQELSELITRLPENQRQVILLKFIEGLDNAEIAQVMGKKEGAIRVLQMRALSKLRQELETEESE